MTTLLFNLFIYLFIYLILMSKIIYGEIRVSEIGRLYQVATLQLAGSKAKSQRGN